MFFVACDPIEKRDKLGPIVPTSEFEYTITQNPEMDYVIYLENKTPKVLFSWIMPGVSQLVKRYGPYFGSGEI